MYSYSETQKIMYSDALRYPSGHGLDCDHLKLPTLRYFWVHCIYTTLCTKSTLHSCRVNLVQCSVFSGHLAHWMYPESTDYPQHFPPNFPHVLRTHIFTLFWSIYEIVPSTSLLQIMSTVMQNQLENKKKCLLGLIWGTLFTTVTLAELGKWSL